MRLASRQLGVAFVLCTACVSVRRPSGDADPQLVMTSAASRTPVVESQTLSLALDRISKRFPVLDGIARRSGTGRGVAIYVFDGGISVDHPELKGRVRIGFDAYPSVPRVCNPHGTAVAGAAAGRTLGVAPEADVVDVKIIDCLTKHGGADAVLAAARWVVKDHRRHPRQAAVANWSFVLEARDQYTAVNTAVELLEDAGILVIASAGNVDADACGISPANSGLAFVVGSSAVVAVDSSSSRDVRAPGTAWGRCIDIFAPGDSVLLPSTAHNEPAVAIWSGTSMATGYVSGAAALVLQQDARATPRMLEQIIERRATPNVVDLRRPGARPARGRLLYTGPAD